MTNPLPNVEVGGVTNVSVVMSVYNGAKYVRQAIESVLHQTFADFEFLITDDGSTDTTYDILEQYARTDSRILVHRQDNMGLTKSLNATVRRARGSWIARQDADDVSMPTRLQDQLRFLSQHPGVGVLGTAARLIDTRGRTLSVITRDSSDAGLRFHLLRGNAFAHGSVIFSRAVFDQVAGYDEHFALSQDYDLWWRMAQHTQLATLPDQLYCLRWHPNSITKSRRIDQAQTADQISERICAESVATTIHDLLHNGRERPVGDVSAIICTKDRPADLMRCLCTLLSQHLLPKEIVVVDAGSDSRVSTIVAPMLDLPRPRVRLIRSAAGLVQQKHAGIVNSVGSIVLFLDDDILLYPDFLEHLLPVFERADGPVGGVMGNMVGIQHDRSGDRARLRRWFFSYGFGDGSFKKSGAATFPYGLPDFRQVEFLGGGQTAYRREVCERMWRADPFFEGYSYLEDVEFSYRVSRRYRNYYVPAARSYHNNTTPLRAHHPDVYRPMKLRNHAYHFRKNVPKSLGSWAAFFLCMFHIKYERRLEGVARTLRSLWQRIPRRQVSSS